MAFTRKATISMTMVLAALLIVPGCTTVTPHQNFKNALQSMLGKNVDTGAPYSWTRKSALIDSSPLPNGNILNRYKYYRGSCIYKFEADPRTRKIVGASFEGKETDCVLNP